MRKLDNAFAQFANTAARLAGSPVAFLTSLLLIVLWAVTGPVFRYSDAWQLVVNTGTSIATFLMVFLIQSTQNRDSTAAQTKLDELIRSSDADGDFIGIEKLTDAELEALHDRYQRASDESQRRLERARAELRARRNHA